MNYQEIQMSLFEVEEKYYLAHCIAADLRMGAGIAVLFQKKFNLREQIRQSSFQWPCSVKIGRVFNLITKKSSFGKPTYNSLEISLQDMKKQIVDFNVKYLAMPRIGCGLDRLNWNKVNNMIKSIFKDIDIDILICYL